MHRTYSILALSVIATSLFASSCCVQEAPPVTPKIVEPPKDPVPPPIAKELGPPVAKMENVVDQYWGVNVNDPYRYMENLDDPYVQEWFRGQANWAAKWLREIPERDVLLARLKELDQNRAFTISSIRRTKEGTLFYKKRQAEENIAKLYLLKAKTNDQRLLIDPETLHTEGEQHYALGAYVPSPDLKYMVYGLAQGGSEKTTYHILELETGKPLSESIDRIENAYNSPKWSDDSKGFFYSRRQKLGKDAPPTEVFKRTKVFYHALGTSPSEDRLIAAMGHSNNAVFNEVDFPSLVLPKRSKFAVLKINHGDSKPITLFSAPKKSLFKDDIPWKKICDVEQYVTAFRVFGNQIYLKTAHDAPRYKIVKTNLKTPNFAKSKTILPEGEYVIDGLAATKDALYVEIMTGGFNRIVRIAHNRSKPVTLALPDGASGRLNATHPELNNPFIQTNSWTQGSKLYDYDAQKETFEDTRLLPEGKFDNLPGFASKEVEVKSHDGTMVPLSILYPENIKLDGTNPTLVYGYGSYGASIRVNFRAHRLAWLERGGVYAYAHVRGGGEKGKEWQLAGQKTNKPNTWKDFMACVEYLIAEGYTSKEKVAGKGISAGGILIGRTITERPDLLRAALIGVGSLDKMRSETTTNGVPNIPEFGTVKIEEEFKALLEMSSYHHVEDGVAYPAVLLTHGMNDPRVSPWSSGKMTARLQAATTSNRPILLRIDYEAGHGIGSRRDQLLEETADQWSFLLQQFGS